MKRWLAAVISTAAIVCAQDSGTVTGRVIGQGAGPLRGDIMAIAGGRSVQMRNILTDEQGAFRIELPPGPAVLVARADGYVSEERQVLVRAGQRNAEIQFVLSAAGSVSGRVFDETGAGVPAARVWVTYLNDGRAWRLEGEAGGEAADAFGYFTIPTAAQNRPFRLHAESDGRLPSSSGTLVLRGQELAGVVLLLSRRGATVRGRLVDAAGVPVAGGEVRLRAMPAEGEFNAEQRASVGFARTTNRTAVSAADGSFAFAAVPSGRVVVTAHAGSRRAANEAATVPGRDVDLTLTLR